MNIYKFGSRGRLFTFDDLGIATNVYVICADTHVFIVDTYLGPDVMKPVNQYISDEFGSLPVIVVNSHSHWDHVWGNMLYKSSLIISHERCSDFMKKEGAKELEEFCEFKRGEVILTYPNLTFSKKIYFESDGVQIYHTPGHSEDSISIYDENDRILFAGDNLERPIPYLMYDDLNRYKATLEGYLELGDVTFVGGHTELEDKKIVIQNLEYVTKFISGDTVDYEVGEYADYHKANLKWFGMKESK